MNAERLEPSADAPLDVEALRVVLETVTELLKNRCEETLSDSGPLNQVKECETLVRQLQAVQALSMVQLVGSTSPATCNAQGGDPNGGSGDDRDGIPNAIGEDGIDQDTDSASVISACSQVSAEIAPLLRISRPWASSTVNSAVRLQRNLPDILDLVRMGELDWYRAKVISDRLHHPLSGPTWFVPGCPEWHVVQAVLRSEAPRKTAPQLKRFIEDLLMSLDPDGANARHRRAKQGREVRFDALPDGMAALHGIFSADVAQVIDGFLDVMADSCRDEALDNGAPDPRTHEQRRADAMAALFEAAAAGVEIPLVRDPRRSEEDSDPENSSTRKTSGIPDATDSSGAAADNEGNNDAQACDSPAQGFPAQGSPRGGSSGDGSPGDGSSGEGSSGEGSRNHGPSDNSSRNRVPPEDGSRDTKSRTGCPDAEQTGDNPQGELLDDASTADRSIDGQGTSGGVPTAALKEMIEAQEAEQDRQWAEFGLSRVGKGQVVGWWRRTPRPGSARGPILVITMTDAALLGLSEEPGLLMGSGAVPADLARKIAFAAERVTLLNPTETRGKQEGRSGRADRWAEKQGGQVQSAWSSSRSDGSTSRPQGPVSRSSGPAGRSERAKCTEGMHQSAAARRYKPSRRLTDLVMARYQSCTHPGCTVPASRCDIDHIVPFGKGGLSCECNLHPACRRHHRLKTFGGWKVRRCSTAERYPVGTVIWTSPAGMEYPSSPDPLPGSAGWPMPARSAGEWAERSGGSEPPEGEERPQASRPDTTSSVQRVAVRLTRWGRDIRRVNDQTERRNRRAGKLTGKLTGKLRGAEKAGEKSEEETDRHGEPPF
ncbi:hypothetical protein GCM10022223_04050 [Kineosporia mesophila]|uniref:DUF222 domain-containing protein n=1 Tax=Kineosporia mesophila TaxID=566012 RepID=A0ABP6Z1L1_9ACTN|nr:HNH endonuclease signature motif containing protein [Kineosporia mesophila]MCD5351885.1 DUF222 domain-containing protein [Kineosporia mesophila]